MSVNSYSTLCVDNPEIKEVFILESGVHLSAQEAIGSNYDKLEELRMELAESIANDEPKYLCPMCHVGVYLVCIRNNADKKFYFRHRSENGNCPAITRGDISKEEIEARKYNGVKESPAHFKIKHLVAESLRHDSNFSNVKVEEVWKGQDRTAWRRPDVQALWKGTLPVAFEIQLSTTFLHVIAERRLFYKGEGGLICWIFKSFDKVSAKMTQDDVFYNNNHNLFLVSDETFEASIEKQALILDCHWTEPVAINGEVSEQWNGRYTNFSELTQDLEQQRIFLFDYDKKKDLLTAKANTEALKQRFSVWWSSHAGIPPTDDNWHYFKREFKSHKAYLPNYPSEVDNVLNALYSAKAGKAVGWKHHKFISVAHTVAGSHKNVLQAFRAALLVYNRADQIKTEDSEGKWAKKVKAYKERIISGDPAYIHDKKYDSLIAFLFPEVWDKIK